MNRRHDLDEIARLKQRNAKAAARPDRFAFYRYLAAVYNFFRRLRRRGVARDTARRLTTILGLDSRDDAHPLRVLLDASSTADSKTKSRWTQGLRYVWRRRNTWTDFTAFVHAHGGIAGCAKDLRRCSRMRHAGLCGQAATTGSPASPY